MRPTIMNNKLEIQLVGDTFSDFNNGNLGYSVFRKSAKNVAWTQDNRDAVFYIDMSIPLALTNKSSQRKFAWLLESRAIIPQVYNWVIANLEECLATFEVIFTWDQQLLMLSDKFKWVPAQGFWIKEPRIYDKSKLVSFISSTKMYCAGHLVRLKYVQELRDYVDLYGRGFNEVENKEDALCDYMFSVAIENDVRETYYTEKILDCFATGTIPVYLGALDIGNLFNLEGIISIDDFFMISPDLYHSKLDAIKDNLERVKKMEILEDFIYERYLADML